MKQQPEYPPACPICGADATTCEHRPKPDSATKEPKPTKPQGPRAPYRRREKKPKPPMHQILLRESVLGHRYTELGNFNKSADLQSLFTVNSGGFELRYANALDPDQDKRVAEVADCPELHLMWHRLSALACLPMREIGVGTLQHAAASKRAAAVPSHFGKNAPSKKTVTAISDPPVTATERFADHGSWESNPLMSAWRRMFNSGK